MRKSEVGQQTFLHEIDSLLINFTFSGVVFFWYRRTHMLYVYLKTCALYLIIMKEKIGIHILTIVLFV